MLTSFFLPVFLVIQILLIYLLSRQTIKEIFYFLRIFFNNEHFIYLLVSLFFLPGTIVHEIGHFLAATILMLQVYEVKIFPERQKNQIKLGSVLYEKKDIFRGILVGIAPIFFAFFFFWFLAQFKLFPTKGLLSNLFLGYVIFTVSSTMFSSKQDLVDFVFIIPLITIIIGTIYIFDLRIDVFLNNRLIIQGITDFLQKINFYLFFSLTVNIILIIFFKIFRFLFKK